MSPRGWSLFAAVSIVWGMPYLFIKIAVDGGMPPLALACGRLALAALVLLPLAHRAGALRPVLRRWRAVVAYAIVEVCIPFPLIATGERHVPSSLAAIIVASVPLLVALLAMRFDHSERVTGWRLMGLLIGLGGVVLLVGVEASGSTDALLGTAAVLVSAVGYAAGPLIFKRMTDLDPRATMGVCLGVGAVILAPLAALTPPGHTPTGGAFAAVAALGLICTALAFTLMAMLIGEIGASRAVVITYVNPVVALGLGVGLLGEHPGTGAIAGLALILAGSWLSTDGRLPPGLRRPFASRRAPQEPGGAEIT